MRALLLVSAIGLLLGVASADARPLGSPQDFPSCGAFWNRNQAVSAVQRRVTTCIVSAARRGRRARAVVVRSTVEGAPVLDYLFVLRRNDVIVLEDGTRDPWGGTFTRLRCTRLAAREGFPAWSSCRPAGSGAPSWLVPYRLPSR